MQEKRERTQVFVFLKKEMPKEKSLLGSEKTIHLSLSSQRPREFIDTSKDGPLEKHEIVTIPLESLKEKTSIMNIEVIRSLLQGYGVYPVLNCVEMTRGLEGNPDRYYRGLNIDMGVEPEYLPSEILSDGALSEVLYLLHQELAGSVDERMMDECCTGVLIRGKSAVLYYAEYFSRAIEKRSLI